MKRNFRILLILAAVIPATLVFALANGSTHTPSVGHQHMTHTGHLSTDMRPVNTADRDRECALADMHNHAQQHFGTFYVHVETFGGSSEWSHLFNLHWIDVEHDGHTVRLYHAIDKHNPQRRFIWTWQSGDPHPTEWQQVR